MDRLISEKAVLEAFREYQCSISDFYKAVKAIPSAEPKEGYWIERRNRATGHIEIVCSECGAEEGSLYNDYCGNCGARMVEKERSEE